MLVCAFVTILHTGPRVQRASGIPRALKARDSFSQTSGASRRENAKLYPRHCDRSDPCRNKKKEWIASRSLSSGAHSRDPVAAQ
jgi:hypothetical protein